MTRTLRIACVFFGAFGACLDCARRRPSQAGGRRGRALRLWRVADQGAPDQGPAYDSLIEKSGLPLFRQAGGRMVGWWKTLIGDLYEHVTIWEYDDMAAFEKAVEFLAKERRICQVRGGARPAVIGRGEPVHAAGRRGDAADLA